MIMCSLLCVAVWCVQQAHLSDSCESERAGGLATPHFRHLVASQCRFTRVDTAAQCTQPAEAAVPVPGRARLVTCSVAVGDLHLRAHRRLDRGADGGEPSGCEPRRSAGCGALDELRRHHRGCELHLHRGALAAATGDGRSEGVLQQHVRGTNTSGCSTLHALSPTCVAGSTSSTSWPFSRST